MNKFAKLVGFDKEKTTVKTEILSGIVTFLAMAYILTLNPSLLLDLFNAQDYAHLYSSVFVATARHGFFYTAPKFSLYLLTSPSVRDTISLSIKKHPPRGNKP